MVCGGAYIEHRPTPVRTATVSHQRQKTAHQTTPNIKNPHSTHINTNHRQPSEPSLQFRREQHVVPNLETTMHTSLGRSHHCVEFDATSAAYPPNNRFCYAATGNRFCRARNRDNGVRCRSNHCLEWLGTCKKEAWDVHWFDWT